MGRDGVNVDSRNGSADEDCWGIARHGGGGNVNDEIVEGPSPSWLTKLAELRWALGSSLGGRYGELR